MSHIVRFRMIQVHVETIYLVRFPSMELQPHWTRAQINLCWEGATKYLHRFDDLMPHEEAIEECNEWLQTAYVKFDPPHFYKKPGERLEWAVTAADEEPIIVVKPRRRNAAEKRQQRRDSDQSSPE